MTNRAIDYYLKNLGTDVRQEVFNMLRDVNPSVVKKLLEKNDNYPSWRRLGFKNDDIKTLLTQSATRFSEINNVMIENKRPPLFERPKDTYGCAQKYVEMLKEKTEEELKAEFGCSWEDYVPKEYKSPAVEASEAPGLE